MCNPIAPTQTTMTKPGRQYSCERRNPLVTSTHGGVACRSSAPPPRSWLTATEHAGNTSRNAPRAKPLASRHASPSPKYIAHTAGVSSSVRCSSSAATAVQHQNLGGTERTALAKAATPSPSNNLPFAPTPADSGRPPLRQIKHWSPQQREPTQGTGHAARGRRRR